MLLGPPENDPLTSGLGLRDASIQAHLVFQQIIRSVVRLKRWMRNPQVKAN